MHVSWHSYREETSDWKVTGSTGEGATCRKGDEKERTKKEGGTREKKRDRSEGRCEKKK